MIESCSKSINKGLPKCCSKKIIIYSGKVASFVISISNKKITSLNLYSPDESTYKHFFALLNVIAGMYKLKNKEPKNHKEIHLAFGEICKIESEKTKSYNTHFHWVGSVDRKDSSIAMSLKLNKIITMKDVAAIMNF